MVYLIPGLVVFILGVVLVVVGLRGRRLDDHPVCRTCGFDLTGVYRGASGVNKCPECGVGLDLPRAVRIGNRRKRRAAIVVGGLLLAVVVVVAGVIGWSLTTKTNLNPYKPVWMLRYEAQGAGKAAAACIDELEMRLTKKTLSEREVKQAVADALAAQADESRTWQPSWAKLLYTAMKLGDLSDEQQAMYFRNGIVMTPIMRATARAGRPVAMQIIPSGVRLAPGATAIVQVDGLVFRIGDGPVKTDERSRMLVSSPTNRTWLEVETTAPTPDQVGPREWTLDYRIIILKGPNDEGPLTSWTGTLRSPIRVGPEDEPLVRVIRNDALADQFRTALQVQGVSLMTDPLSPPPPQSQYQIRYRALPEPVTFDVFWRWKNAKGVEHESWVGAMSCPAGAESGYGESRYNNGLLGVPTDLASVDVVLRPSVDRAEQNTSVTATWIGPDIVFEGVPMVWRSGVR